MKSLAVAAIGAALLLPVVSGCAAFTDDSASSADGVEVAAAFYPLQYVAERVAGDRLGHGVTVETLTAPGGEPHDLELSPKQVADVAQADLVVYERGFQQSVDDAVDTNATGDTVDAASVVDLVPFREHGVDSDEIDPHFWQDPLMLADVADTVADHLADIDPGHADDYQANADDLRSDLEQLDQDYTAGLASCERSTVVVSHDAFGYLQRYGIQMKAILGLSPESEPTPADLAELQDLVKSEGITTVFSETLAPKEVAESLAHDTGVKSAVLDPIEGLSDETADEDYLSLMRSNLSALQEANGC
ncbi:metal ABC transporter substrate-binding protein [Nocardioides mangrovi]|uniref:Metal ABC transporter substrate-binding protein n=1 Tax=Nocardioides mangrovi TaxID=2874580 RepID=A0ABS7UJ02_9ACTN|nr:metal ABC transporter substrate-binding protein [Nocardioides mangrovi]MBZ5741018.1 metal ABC transporter substrate-binding protein [Nocardioides mangrovi]